MLRPLLRLILLCISLSGFALSEDTTQPVLFHADSADINPQLHIGTYLENVALDQGSTHIRATKAITLTNTKNELISAVIDGSTKTQAHYWSLQAPEKPMLHAYADKICYCPQSHQIVLSGRAHIEQGHNKIDAHTICYNTLTQQVNMPFHSGLQTVMIIQPTDPHA